MRALLVTVLSVAIVGVVALKWAYADVVRRPSQGIEDLPPYGEALRSLPLYGDTVSRRDNEIAKYSGPAGTRVDRPTDRE